ncbi:MAG TPA: hypothetical protein VHR86_00540 [Armatimonadota bacterium]|nr:hypothetical protein [Armatimonadota bacterium]
MKCDTRGKESARLARVVIDQGYNRSMAKPLWNCPECFEKKEQARRSKARATADTNAAKAPANS